MALGVARSFVRIGFALNSDGSGTTLTQDFVTDREDEQVDVVIVRINRTTNAKQEFAFSVPTERRFRIRFSTGLVGTGVDSWHYDRVQRENGPNTTDASSKPPTEGSEPDDSTYSTWARVGGGNIDIASPAFFVSMSLARTAIDLNVSAGTTLRTVDGGSATLEPLLGLGVGILDRFFLHVGVHLGRQEELILTGPRESPQKVQQRPVSTSLTRGDAVGVRWKAQPFIGFSLRIN